MADRKTTTDAISSVANAIRTRGSTQAQLQWPSGFASAIAAIPGGGGGGAVEVDVIVDNKNTPSSGIGQSAVITTNKSYAAVYIVAFTANTGSVIAPTLSASGDVSIIEDQIVNNFFATKTYAILAHAENVPSGTTFTASVARNSASGTLYLFGINVV